MNWLRVTPQPRLKYTRTHAPAAELTPNHSTRLRYALVMATPGHPGSDPAQAQHVFRELLAQTELMTPGEISLTTIHLKEVESRIMLAAGNRSTAHRKLGNCDDGTRGL